MKTKRSKIKSWLMSGKNNAMFSLDLINGHGFVNIGRNLRQKKAHMMANARKQVNNQSNVGRGGRMEEKLNW